MLLVLEEEVVDGVESFVVEVHLDLEVVVEEEVDQGEVLVVECPVEDVGALAPLVVDLEAVVEEQLDDLELDLPIVLFGVPLDHSEVKGGVPLAVEHVGPELVLVLGEEDLEEAELPHEGCPVDDGSRKVVLHLEDLLDPAQLVVQRHLEVVQHLRLVPVLHPLEDLGLVHGHLYI